MKSVLALLLLCFSAVAQAEPRLTIAAASDLRYAFSDIIALYRQQQPQLKLDVVYGASGKLSTQIRHGAPFDLFFSADISFAQQLYDAGYAVTLPQPYAVGHLVLWSPKHTISAVTLQQLPKLNINRLAIAEPAHAPYGLRAKQALQAAGVWQALEAKLVYGENIAQTAQLAQSGAADLAIIALSLAKSPALASHGYQPIPAQLHQPLLQAFVITRHGDNNPVAHQFTAFMASASVQQIMQRFGFEPPPLPTPVTVPADQAGQP